jgi:hypothetical protein
MTDTTQTPTHPADATRYALLLDWGTRLGVLTLVLSFGAYLFGVLPPHVPLDQLPSVWTLPVSSYLQRTQSPTGWGWLALAHKGDLTNLIGIALLAGCSLPPLLGLVPLYLSRGDRAYAAICIAIATVLVMAASGLLTGGH